MDRIRLAFVGCGDVAQRDYLPELYRLADQVELVAVCGRTEARTRAVAEQYAVPAWYTDYTQMLVEAEFNALVNLTPIQMHTTTTLAALRAGKHVYTEKPVATCVEDVLRIQDEAERHKRTLVCAPCVLLFPQVHHARRLIEAGELGSIYSARGHGHGGVPPWHGYFSDPSPYFASGGGPALDMGVYPLHALTGLFGPAQRVSAFAARSQNSFTILEGPYQGTVVPVEVPDNWHMLLDFGNGRLATVDANNCVQGTHAPQLEVFGLQGTLALNLLDVAAPVELLQAGSGWKQIDLPQTGRRSGPDHLLGIAHLVECIQSNRTPVLNVRHALHVVEIIEQAARSATAGRSMDITSRFENTYT